MLAKLVVTTLSCALFAFASVAYGQAIFETRLAEGQPPVVIAHRSAEMGGFPENSLAWIQYGIDRGVDVVHLNPQLTADDRYVLMHDPTLNRMTDVETVFPEGAPGGPSREKRGGRDYVRDYRLDDIRKLHLTSGGMKTEHRIPTLEEALDFADGRILVIVGLKSYEIDSLAPIFEGRDTSNVLVSDLYVSGTDQSKLRALSDRTGVDVGIVLYQSRDYLSDLGKVAEQIGPALRMVWVRSNGLTEEFVVGARARGLAIAIGGWDGGEDSALARRSDPGPWTAMLDHGFAAATDRPDLVLELLGR